jgi:hypothetical protein
VIGVPSAVVSHGNADVFWNRRKIGDEILQANIEKLWVLFQSGVQVVHIGLVVLGVMDLHCFRIYVRLERIVGIGHLRQGML